MVAILLGNEELILRFEFILYEYNGIKFH